MRKVAYLSFLSFISIFLCVMSNDEILAVNCRNGEVKKYFNSSWELLNDLSKCSSSDNGIILSLCLKSYEYKFEKVSPFKSRPQTPECDNIKCPDFSDNSYKFYKCIRKSRFLKVPEHCIFQHFGSTVDKCSSIDKMKLTAQDVCTKSGYNNLTEVLGVFDCKSAEQPLYKGVEFVCCAKLNMYDLYMRHLKESEQNVELELEMFLKAKKALRERFKKRQKEISNRFIREEYSLKSMSKYPSAAQFVEEEIQKRFRTVFMEEMNKELELLKELEIIHENRMQNLFEKTRKESIARLKYVLQEFSPEMSRILRALKLDLKSILDEATNIIQFFDSLVAESLQDVDGNKDRIEKNFYSLINQCWDDSLKLLNEVPQFKIDVIQNIKSLEVERQSLIKRFQQLNNRNIPKNSMRMQVENYIKNIISMYGRDQNLPVFQNSTRSQTNLLFDNKIVIMSLSIGILILLVIITILYRWSGKINYYLTNTFKKIHPPSKSVFVHIENYPFKSRYNYGNKFYQPYVKTEESSIGSPSSLHKQRLSNGKGHKDGLGSVKADYMGTCVSNINGLENPICRLLDEK